MELGQTREHGEFWLYDDNTQQKFIIPLNKPNPSPPKKNPVLIYFYSHSLDVSNRAL